MAPKRSARRGQHAAEQQVADLGRGDVDDAGQQAAVDELFHRAPAGAGGVEDHAVVAVAQLRRRSRVTQGVVTPNMVRPMRRLAVGGRGGVHRHAGDRLRGIVQDDAAEAG